MKKIKIAQIGTSKYSHGNLIWKTLLDNDNLFEVVGYALPENEKIKFPEQVKAFEEYKEMSVEEIINNPDIDAVAVETEEIYLTKYALMVAKAGKHLHMEKPGGTNLDEFKELVQILKEKNLAFSLGYMYRFNPTIKDAIKKIHEGKLGKIISIEAQMNCKHNKETREWLNNFPGGMMFFLGCHLIDLIYQIQGTPLEIIPLNCSTNIENVNSKDFGMVIYKYSEGVSFAKTSASERGGFLRRQLVITGEKGSIEIKPLEVDLGGIQYTISHEYYDLDWHKEWDEHKSNLHHRYNDMIVNFYEIIRGKNNPYSYEYELELYKLLLKSCEY